MMRWVRLITCPLCLRMRGRGREFEETEFTFEDDEDTGMPEGDTNEGVEEPERDVRASEEEDTLGDHADHPQEENALGDHAGLHESSAIEAPVGEISSVRPSLAPHLRPWRPRATPEPRADREDRDQEL